MSTNNKKYSIALPILLLLFISLYFTYTNIIGIMENFSGYIIYLILSLTLGISSIYGLYKLLRSTKYTMHNLASHVNQKQASAKQISERILSNDKLAFDYVKSSFDRLVQRETRISAEYQANKSFLNSFSYEVSAPMNAISGYSKLLNETTLSKEQKELIHLIESNYTKLDFILNQMNVDSTSQDKTRKQKNEMKNIPFNIVKEVESAVESFSVKADKKDIVLGLYIDPDISHNLLGEGTKLSQVITHLIDNALDASPEYTTVNIELEKISSKGNSTEIKFSISNEGKTLEQKILNTMNKIFDDLEIVEDDEIPNIKNLTISNRIISNMGGILEVKSRKIEDTCFSFTLEYKKDTDEVDRKSNSVFKGLTIGLALPHKDIQRQIDYNLQTYVEYLGGTFKMYGYDEIIDNINIKLPDIMFVYHSYAKNQGELDIFSNLDCKTILITSGTLRTHIDEQKHLFTSVVYAPITMSKILRVLSDSNNVNKNKENKTAGCDNIHALVTEDNTISLTIMSNILQNMNVSVTLAVNGKEAFELRQRKDFDIIFMDINMPVMGGYEATSKILSYEKKNKLRHIPIIAFSADKLDASRYEKAGMEALLTKPIHVDKIKEIIEIYCFDTMKAS